MSILGIIPAAGEGKRWGGYFKELLPIGYDTLLDRSISAMFAGGADKIAIVSKPDKITTHAKHLSKRNADNIFFAIQNYMPELYGAVDAALPFSEDLNYFCMPDTYFPETAFKRDFSKADFHLGLFETTTPERFGVLYRGKVFDKQRGPKGVYEAWGVLVWSRKVSEFWYEIEPKNYTYAINLAMENFNWDTFELDYYYDMASWKDYEEFIKNGKT